MTLSVGLDFGTSNSSVAVYDGQRVTLAPLDAAGRDPSVMRSLLYLTKQGERFVGQEAFDRHQRDNVGRAVKLERHYVGDVTMTFSGVGTITIEANALIDVNEPGRLFQSIKSLLPDRVFARTSVYGVDLTAEDLVVLLAGEIVQRAERFLGRPIERLTVGRPVHFSAKAADDALARERLRAAVARLGVPHLDFLEEPVAAGIGFAQQGAAPADGRPFLVFDFGGGTLDVTVLRGAGERAEVLATGGTPIGGDLLDRRIVEARLLRQFGESATYGPRRLPVPRHILARLLDWQTLYLLNRPQPLAQIEEIQRSSSQPRELANLHTLVTRGYGAALYRAVEEAKQRLSEAGHAPIALEREGIDVRDVLTREGFEGIIRAQYDAALALVDAVVREAGVAPEAVGALVTTGGSSRIPLFQRGLRGRFPNARLAEQHAFTSVAAGLAIAGWQGRRAAA
ncbi:MAG TPA: Hsp70 family protein [Dehalococcoidia bacterium]|nr:Hsp70 family protein [Dehalococcoidia bacterium]